jgi:hypothetical protein
MARISSREAVLVCFIVLSASSPGKDEPGVSVPLGMDHHVRHIVHQAEGDISDLAIVASVIHPVRV